MVHRPLPDDAEVAGLLALMLLTDARRPARTDADGELIPLAEQDRTLWDRALIAEGTALLDDAIGRGRVGEYQLQAAIAAIHDRAPRADDTDWPQILALYGLLERMTAQPDRHAQPGRRGGDGRRARGGPGDARRRRASASPATTALDAVRAHLLEMAGDTDGAVAHYRAAAGRTTSLPEQRYLTTQAARLRAPRP